MDQSEEIKLNYLILPNFLPLLQPTITCAKLTIEALEKGVRYVQS